MNWLDLLDMVNVIDRIGGLLYGLVTYHEIGRQIRVRHVKRPDGKTPKTHTGNHYADILALYRIPVWMRRATADELIFNVRAGQWQWAIDLLTIYGAPVVQQARPWTARRNGRMPTPWAVKGNETPEVTR